MKSQQCNPARSSYMNRFSVALKVIAFALGFVGAIPTTLPSEELEPEMLHIWPKYPTGGIGGVAALGDLVITTYSQYNGPIGAPVPQGGLHFLNISDPTNPEWISSFSTGLDRVPKLVRIHESMVLVLHRNNEPGSYLQIIDISNTSAPNILGEYTSENDGTGVAVQEGLVFLLTPMGLEVIDISNPTDPTEVGLFTKESLHADEYRRLTIWNDYVLITGSNLSIIDVRTPSAPELAGDLGIVGRSITTIGNHALITGPGSMVDGDLIGPFLRVVDLNDPTNPQVASSYEGFAYASKIKTFGNLAILTGRNAGVDTSSIELVDFSDPLNPNVLGRFEQLGRGFHDLIVTGNLALFADYFGLRILDLSNPNDPHQVGG